MIAGFLTFLLTSMLTEYCLRHLLKQLNGHLGITVQYVANHAACYKVFFYKLQSIFR